MPIQYSRKELYDLAWAEPMRDIAGRLGLSDVGLAKIYKKADVPFPPRGYWAKKRSGAPVVQVRLPHRSPGAPERIWIGGEPRNWGYGDDWEKAVLESPVPPVPQFDEEMEAFKARAQKLVGHVPFLPTFQAAFGDVSKLLAQDEKRRASQWSFDKPIYDSGLPRRRLLIIHSIFFALRRFGCTPSMRTAQYLDDRDRGVHVRVGDGHVTFTVEPVTAKGAKAKENKEPQRLRLTLTQPFSSESRHWDETSESHLEKKLTEIVVQTLVFGEEGYRASLARARNSLIEQKERISGEIRKREGERIRKEREMLATEQKERVAALLAQAADLQRAAAIRSYVQAMKEKTSTLPVTAEKFALWEAWALAEADRIDPGKSLKFLDLVPSGSAQPYPEREQL